MNSRRRMSDPKLRRQHLIGSNECFDRGQTGIKTIAAVQSQCRLWVLAVSKRFAQGLGRAGLRCELLFPALTMLGLRPSAAGCP
jgi:hypothetical protein